VAQPLQFLFTSILTKIQKIRQAAGLGFDGLGAWKPIKAIALTCSGDAEFNNMDAELSTFVTNLIEFNQFGGLIEGAHFVKQLIRIPKETATVKSVLQIALNIGQYLSMSPIEAGDFLSNEDFYKYELGKLSTYLSPEAEAYLSAHVTEKTFKMIIDYLDHLEKN
jgi:hypothetical protein